MRSDSTDLKAAVDECVATVTDLKAAVDECVARVVGLDDPERSAHECVEMLVEHDVPLGVAEQRVTGSQHGGDARVAALSPTRARRKRQTNHHISHRKMSFFLVREALI